MVIENVDAVLCRSYLEECDSISVLDHEIMPCDMWWFQVCGITDFWKDMKPEAYEQIFQELLGGCMMPFCRVGILILGDGKNGIRIYLGITDDEELFEMLRTSCRGRLPGIELSEKVEYKGLYAGKRFGGIAVGIPCQTVEEKEGNITVPLENLCRSMAGMDFTLLILAERQPEVLIPQAVKRVESLLMQNSSLLTSSRSNAAGLQVTYTNMEAKQYQENLEREQKLLYDSFWSGLWNTAVLYAANNSMDLLKLKNSLLSGFSGQGCGRYERFRCIDVDRDFFFLNEKAAMILREDLYKREHPMNDIWQNGNGEEYYKYCSLTRMNGTNLAHFWKLPQREMVGFYVDNYVEYDVMVREKPTGRTIRIGNITASGRKGGTELSNEYETPLDDLTRHALIVGITGGGKTNTMKALLSEIWRKNGVPFLVIESAKREYIELMQIEPQKESQREFDSLLVFTLGNESPQGVRFRLNPFEVMEGVSLQTHIDYLFSTFSASFEMVPPMPQVLERAIYEVYEDKGWDLFTGENGCGMTEYPTLTQLYYKIDSVTERLGYDSEVESNVRAALKTRINSLRIGGKGAMLDTARSIPIHMLLNSPCVLELEDVGDDDTKAFIIGILMVQLYEYRKACGSSRELQGVLIIEEAHRLLKNVGSGEGGNTRAKAVEFFCNMLAEIRSFGQGIMIADQIPTKLAVDTIKNTNLKIVHRTVMEDDRRCMGAAMHMTEEQTEYLSSLRRGCAAVFSEGDNRPKLVAMPLVTTCNLGTRQEYIQKIRCNAEIQFGTYYGTGRKKHIACVYCERQCCLTEEVLDKVRDFQASDYKNGMRQQGYTLTAVKSLIKTFKKEQNIEMIKDEQILCLMGYLMRDAEVPEEKQAAICTEYIKQLYPIKTGGDRA